MTICIVHPGSGPPPILAQSRAFAVATAPVKTTSAQPPRTVIVGTVLQRFWGAYLGLDNRLEQPAGIVDKLAAESMSKYGRGLDLAVLPEAAVTGEPGRDIVAGSFPFAGAVEEKTFARKAREHHCYIVVPMFLAER